MTKFFDLAVIGGGINGCGIAADAALRGLSVILIEKDDIASKTSSSSSKLIHGGLRYLEYYDFSLVKKALDERQTLLSLAPHLIDPLPFVLPYLPSMRPMWLLRAGLFLYDNLSRKNKLPKSKLIKRAPSSLYFSPLKQNLTKGFLFYDCNTDDARLTLVNALQAKEYGAEIHSYTALTDASVKNNTWHLQLCDQQGQFTTCQARSLVNATGPWVASINHLLGLDTRYQMSLIKGSHLVVRKLYEGNQAYLLQNNDKRIVFVIPYHHYSLIGTTDVPFKGDLNQVSISPEEIDYLLNLISLYFNQPLTNNDILFSWSGVRPLIAEPGESPQAISRDYTYHYTSLPAPAVTIYGGKITTYRQLAREAVNQLKTVFPHLSHSITHKTPLPGAVFHNLSYQDYVQYAHKKYSWLADDILKRLLKTYGTRLELILAHCNQLSDLGLNFGHGLFQREVDYLREQEWVIQVDDLLWRRTKLGINFDSVATEKLANYLLGKD
ncbi:glycerol-3-phosphate dehydrogenase [Legionella beliardensis]|uniref:Glycerol-3-phosphate dehydrogenase n=1 Tax=Legionella beliardensis TaxID=91822 RepID=A0A378I0P8_9GAMM|nr:glycerol-3-phosphate dehydrogenase [Legionella beliardensis]STX28768.1 glycerol-3-phosphate dehydrogenase [Legionella beliardensis]